MLRFEIELITPAKAQEYLSRNTQNRPLRKRLVSLYAQDMKAGMWRLTHQGIAFNCDGTLLDGQHRLAAIIESGVAVQMIVCYGVENKSQIVMDDHAKRTAGDALSLDKNEQITSTDIAIVRGVIELSAGRGRSPGSRMSKQTLADVFDKFRSPMKFAADTMRTTERGIRSAPVRSAVVLAWFYVADLERLKWFCDIVCGRDIAENHGDRAAVALREWLLRTGVQHSNERIEAFKKTQRAIVAFMEHKDISKLYGTTIYYPWPLVAPVRESV